MIEKMIVGRYLNLHTLPQLAHLPPPGGFFATPNTHYYLDQSHKAGGKRTSGYHHVPAPEVRKAHRNFRWLPWAAGSITELRIPGVEVLSGPFSGCWLTVYLRGGQYYVGHVGTSEQAAATAAVKLTWNTTMVAHPGNVLAAFNPFRPYRHVQPPAQEGEITFRVYAVVTNSFRCYAIFTWRDSVTNLYRIAEVQEVPNDRMGVLPIPDIPVP